MRAKLLDAIARNPGATLQEISDAISERDERRVRSNLDATLQGRLIQRKLGDVTRRPGYWLTGAGREWLAKNSGGAPAAPNRGGQFASSPSKTGADPGETAGGEPADDRSTSEGDALSEADESLLLDVVAQIRSAIGDTKGRIMLAELAQAVRDRIRAAAASVDHPDDKLAMKVSELTEERTRQAEQIKRHEQAITQWQEIGARLGFLGPEAALARVNELLEAEPSIDVKDAATAYLVRAPKRRPQIRKNPEQAVAAAMAAARNGSGSGHVYALVPIGRAVRGAEWRDA